MGWREGMGKLLAQGDETGFVALPCLSVVTWVSLSSSSKPIGAWGLLIASIRKVRLE